MLIQYLIAGLVLGGIYAITSASIVMTFVSAGVLNFAFGAIAYGIARFYYFLNTQQHWPIVPAALVSVVIVAPAIGLILWALLFRSLRSASTLIKVVATIGLAVTIPALVAIIFGSDAITGAPGLAPEPVRVFHLAGVPITADQLLVLLFVIVIGVLGVGIVKYTSIGLAVRAMVDSEAMTSLSGTNPQLISAGVWAVSMCLAGLVGILITPVIGLDSSAFTLLMASAFGAVVVAKLRSVSTAALVSICFGLVTGVFDRYLPSSSSLTSALLTSIPFIFMMIALLFFIRAGSTEIGDDQAGALDRAIRPSIESIPETLEVPSNSISKRSGHSQNRIVAASGPIVIMALIVALPLLLSGLWIGLIAEGMAFALAFLSYTLVAGEGGMIWLCEISFAGLGAILTAQLAGVHGLPILFAITVSAFVVLILGLLIGLVIVRFGSLYIALTTLALGFLADGLVFSLQVFSNFGSGVNVGRPSFATSDRGFAYLMIAVFCVISLLIVRLRRSTAGLALAAIRSSESASRMLGLNVTAVRVLLSGAAAFVAALGGGFLASYAQVAQPTSFATLTGMVWLAVLVTVGARSNIAAAIAGLSFTIIPAIFILYLPLWCASVPAALFGLGAVMVVKNPDGVVAMYGRWVKALLWKKPVLAGASKPVKLTWDPDLLPGTLPTSEANSELSSASVSKAHDRTSDHFEGGQALPVLEARNISVQFGGVTALCGVTLTVPAASIVGLVGPNGAGKTTLFGVVSGLTEPDQGEVSIMGKNVGGKSPQYRARRGLARTFQHPQLFSDLTVREHILLADRLRNSQRRMWTDLWANPLMKSSDNSEQDRVDSLIEVLGIGEIAERRVDGLSLGLCRLVEVARALALEPAVLLLDEPSAGLDSRETEKLSAVLAGVNASRGVAMLLVEHDLSMVLSLSETVYVLDFGNVIAHGPPELIREDPSVRSAYLGIESHAPLGVDD